MTDRELAWMAGLFEGEGCVMHYHYAGHTARGLQLGSTDLDVVTRFARLAECGTVVERHPGKLGNKPMHYWTVTRWDNLWPLLVMLQPEMGERRGAAMQALLDDPPRESAEECPKCGGELVVAPGDTARRCTPCRRESQRAQYAKRTRA